MIKTKCILDPPEKSDGTRICVMRWVRSNYIYDIWIKALSPSARLIKRYLNNEVDWKYFELMYKHEIKQDGVRYLLRILKKRSDDGEIITLLCHEKSDKKCHRRLLKELIENET